MNFRTYQPGLMNTALQDPYGQAFQRALGIVKDYLAMRTRISVQQRFPSFAVPDALGGIGDERGIDQGNDIQLSVPETNAAYAARLRDAWNLWLLGGSAWGMLKAFGEQGYFPQIVCKNGLIYSVGAGPTFTLTITQGPVLSMPLWSEFFIWFPSPPSSWTDMVSPPTPTSTPTIYELRRLRNIIIQRWKPAWALCMGIFVLTAGSPGIWGAPGATWGAMGATWDASVVVEYSATDYLTWGFPPGYSWAGGGVEWGGGSVWGGSGLNWGSGQFTWGQQV